MVMIRNVAIFGSANGRVTNEHVTKLVNILLRKKIRVNLHHNLLCKLDEPVREKVFFYLNILECETKPDMVLSLGGDGTFLETILQVRDSGVLVAGVNAGRLGFLANIQDDIEESIDKLISGRFTIIERHLIKLLEPVDILGNSNVALNDITIQKSDLNMIMIKVFVDDLYLNTYWADGLIISTATGSTAYNLSTGGPILVPEDDSIIISPLSPHNLTVRPIILPGNSKLMFTMEGRSSEYLVTCDFRSVRVPFSMQLIIGQPEYKIRTVNIDGHDFFSTLRNKLMWGADPRN